jgi:hypothetical protein
MKTALQASLLAMFLLNGLAGQQSSGQPLPGGQPPTAPAPVVSWQRSADDPGDLAQKQLFQVTSTEAKYLQGHPGAAALQHRDAQLRFRNPNGSKAAILGSVTRRDLQTGNWLPNQPVLSQTANGWRLDGAANEIKIRKKGSDQHTVTQTYPDLDTRHESVLSLTLPALAYDKDLSFHYTTGGVPWTVR